MNKVSVITGDIIGSTGLRNNRSKDKLLNLMKRCFKEIKLEEKRGTLLQQFEIFRGDSFQGVVIDVKRSLLIALKLKAGLLMKSSQLKGKRLDARISVGIGDSGTKSKTIKESDGEAFHLSGKQLDEMKAKDYGISIISDDEKLNKHLEMLSTMLDLITSKWTPQQAEVIYHLLNQKTQIAIAKKLRLRQPSINQRAQLGNKNEIMKMLDYFDWLMVSI